MTPVNALSTETVHLMVKQHKLQHKNLANAVE